jgi:hypothetical protein
MLYQYVVGFILQERHPDECSSIFYALKNLHNKKQWKKEVIARTIIHMSTKNCMNDMEARPKTNT